VKVNVIVDRLQVPSRVLSKARDHILSCNPRKQNWPEQKRIRNRDILSRVVSSNTVAQNGEERRRGRKRSCCDLTSESKKRYIALINNTNQHHTILKTKMRAEELKNTRTGKQTGRACCKRK